MKHNFLLKLIIITALLPLSACKEYFITTKINRDGTVERSVVCKTDKTEKGILIPDSFLTDSLWDVRSRYDSSAKKSIFTANIKFSSYEKAVEYLKKSKRNFDPVIDISIDKNYRLFFTYYTYKETYRPFNIFKKTPIEKYFTPDEIAKLKLGTDSAWVKKKLDEYFNYNFIDMFYDSMEQMYLSAYGANLSDMITPEKKKEFLAEMRDAAKNNKDDSEAEKLIEKFFDKTTSLRLIKYVKDNKIIENMLQSMSRYDGNYENGVIMPGIITSSNSGIIEGNKVTWKFSQDNFKYFEHEMRAESREVNMLTIVISGLLIIIIVIGLLLPKLRKRNAF